MTQIMEKTTLLSLFISLTRLHLSLAVKEVRENISSSPSISTDSFKLNCSHCEFLPSASVLRCYQPSSVPRESQKSGSALLWLSEEIDSDNKW